MYSKLFFSKYIKIKVVNVRTILLVLAVPKVWE